MLFLVSLIAFCDNDDEYLFMRLLTMLIPYISKCLQAFAHIFLIDHLIT